jgi:cytochrome c553
MPLLRNQKQPNEFQGALMKALIALLLLASFTFAAEDERSAAHAGIPADQLLFFEKNIRPMLVEHCYKCHSAESEKIKGGLTLDTKQGTALGGESGHPGVTPGNIAESSLYESITWANDDMQMPPKTKLPEAVIANFKKWIEMGAPDPREQKVANAASGKRQIDVAKGREHWAFQKPVKSPLPTVKTEGWARSDIDAYILAGLEKAGLAPVKDADRATLIRRMAYDLTGLPPTPDEVKAFLTDTSAEAVKRVIDQYLDSPRFGERWGRHWLDIARYAESNGKETNVPYPHAWRYRDYVIESFNKDKPYDLFLKEQIAGDLMQSSGPRDQAEKIIATGFLALGAKNLAERDRRQFQMDLIDEQMDALSQSMLGLTLACARCHDHKFDPVTQRDYYALAGIFMSSDTLYGTPSQLQNNHPSTLIELDGASAQPSAVAALGSADLARLKQEVQSLNQAAEEAENEAIEARRKGPNSNPAGQFLRVRAARDRAATAKADLDLFDAEGRPRTLAMGTLDRAQPINSAVLVRGDIKQPGDVVPRGLVEVLCAPDEPRNIAEGSGRLDLAYWIASKEHPLTARVMANRVWLKLMGSGIVATPDNFGVMGEKPTHPELLDQLALTFMEQGWSVKQLIREIMLSRSYQMGSGHDPKNFEVDPDNRWHWRMNQRRLDAEAIRDAMLSVAGVLDLYPVDGSPVARVREDRQGMIQMLTQMNSQPSQARSIYLPIIRDQIPEVLATFDFPDASLVSGERDTTNVPGQSLFLMNNPQVLNLADAFAKRLGALPGTAMEKLSQAYQLTFSRPPTPPELEAIRRFWSRFPEQAADGKQTPQAREQAQKLALSAFCQSLFASADFRYLN